MTTVRSSPWAWVPSLYLVQGLPYVLVMSLSVVMYKNLGLGNTEIALYTSWLYLPWVIKPLWSPLIELLGCKRGWIVAMQGLVGAALAALALALPQPGFVQATLALFWLMAFASASHDIAADGFYLLALPRHQQAAFVGVRSTFYKLANIGAQGGLVFLAGWLQAESGSFQSAWAQVFGLAAALLLLAALYHQLRLPKPAADQPQGAALAAVARESLQVFRSFFAQPRIAVVLAFLLLYRFPEAQLLKLASPFLLDARSAGGLGLSTQALGLAYGTVGLVALMLGGLLGGWLISRHGLRRLLWPLVLAMHLPNLAFVALAQMQPESLALISAALAIEQFGYGLGFTAYLVAMMLFAEGDGHQGENRYKTAHYALCTGFMALGMMLPGLWSGWLQAQLGYLHFFLWVLLATLPSLAATALLRVPEGFGRQEPSA